MGAREIATIETEQQSFAATLVSVARFLSDLVSPIGAVTATWRQVLHSTVVRPRATVVFCGQVRALLCVILP